MSKLRIAISGGGLASLCLAYALNKQDQWEVQMFEARSELYDEGAAIGLGSNAQQALQLISPDLMKALRDAGGVTMEPSARLMMGTGPDAGQHIGDIKPVQPQITVHRGAFWRALRQLLPNNDIQWGKRLTKIDDPKDDGCSSVRIHFDDGDVVEADALIGCDGINSITRVKVLGADHPAAKPVFTNGYNHRVVVPLETAKEAFGEEYCSIQTQYGWVGQNGFLLTDHIDHGQSMQVIGGGSGGEPWPYNEPVVEWSKEKTKESLADWGEIGKAMTKIYMDQPKLYAAAGRIHLDTPTYCKGPICIAGDAAQTFPPFQGAGAGQAIEDVLILSTALAKVSTTKDIPRAFEVYDLLRRPRRADVARSSKWAALLLTGRAPGIGLNRECIAAELPSWASNIYEYDLIGAQKEAARLMSTK